MTTKILFKVACIGMFVLLLHSKAIAQQTAGGYSIGLKSGYAYDPWSTHIRNHIVYGVFVERSLTAKISVLLLADYFQSSDDGVWARLEHRGTLYTAMTPYVWQNIAVGIDVDYSLLNWLRAGGGIAANAISIQRITYAQTNPFIISYPEENISLEGEQNHANLFVRPSAFLTLDFSYPVAQSISAIFQERFTADFLGCSIPENQYLISGNFEMSLNIKYRFR